jgi:hypothetical protein
MTAGLWRHRNFLLLWGGQTASQTGSQVTIVALPLVAIVLLQASTFQVGLLATATTSAFLLISLPAGCWPTGSASAASCWAATWFWPSRSARCPRRRPLAS